MFASEMLARVHALDPLDALHVDGLALFASGAKVTHAVSPKTRSGIVTSDPSTWRNPRVIQQAIHTLTDKHLLTPAQFDARAAAYKSAGVEIAQATGEHMQEVVDQSLADSLAAGHSVDEAAAAAQASLDAAGYSRLAPTQAKVAAQMAHINAYATGQRAVLTDPRVRAILPAWKYVTMEDGVCPRCGAMDGFTAAQDDPAWNTWYPPNHMLCRCSVVGVPAAQWDGGSDALPQVLGNDIQPDAGFQGLPGEFVGKNAGAAARKQIRTVDSMARKLPAGYHVPDGWRVVAVFEDGGVLLCLPSDAPAAPSAIPLRMQLDAERDACESRS